MSAVLSPEAPARSPEAPARYLDAQGCAARYAFSWRHWLRLVDSGRAPQAVHFGRLVRWSITSLEEWEGAGCPCLRSLKGAGR